MTITTYEKLATIVLSAEGGQLQGTFGDAIDISDSTNWSWRVWVTPTEQNPAGAFMLVRRSVNAGLGSWQVQFKGFVGEDANLERAARAALEAGAGINVTRNYQI